MENLASFNTGANCFGKTIEMTTEKPSLTTVSGTRGTDAFGSLKIYGVTYADNDMDKAFVKYVLNLATIPDTSYVGEIVWNDNECNKLACTTCQYIIVVDGVCNSRTGELKIENHAALEYFAIGANSLNKVTKFTLKSNPALITVDVMKNSLQAVTELYIDSKYAK